MDQNQASIEQLFERFADRWSDHDGTGVAALFAEDGSLVNPFGQRADGRAAVGEMYSQYFDSMLKGTSVSTRTEHVRAVGADRALVDAEQIITGPGGDVVMTVHLAALLERRGETWWFVDSRPYTVAPVPSVP